VERKAIKSIWLLPIWYLQNHKCMKMKKIVIEAEFVEFKTLTSMLTEIVELARSGQQYNADGTAYKTYIKQRYKYHLDFMEKTPWVEKEIDGVIHLIIKSKI